MTQSPPFGAAISFLWIGCRRSIVPFSRSWPCSWYPLGRRQLAIPVAPNPVGSPSCSASPRFCSRGAMPAPWPIPKIRRNSDAPHSRPGFRHKQQAVPILCAVGAPRFSTINNIETITSMNSRHSGQRRRRGSRNRRSSSPRSGDTFHVRREPRKPAGLWDKIKAFFGLAPQPAAKPSANGHQRRDEPRAQRESRPPREPRDRKSVV